MLAEREIRDALGHSGRFFGHEGDATDAARSFSTEHHEGAQDDPAGAQQRLDTLGRQDLRAGHVRHATICDS